jgi:chromosome segregation ATPase
MEVSSHDQNILFQKHLKEHQELLERHYTERLREVEIYVNTEMKRVKDEATAHVQHLELEKERLRAEAVVRLQHLELDNENLRAELNVSDEASSQIQDMEREISNLREYGKAVDKEIERLKSENKFHAVREEQRIASFRVLITQHNRYQARVQELERTCASQASDISRKDEEIRIKTVAVDRWRNAVSAVNMERTITVVKVRGPTCGDNGGVTDCGYACQRSCYLNSDGRCKDH